MCSSFTDILNDASATQYFNEHFNEIAPVCYAFEASNGHTAAEISEMIRDFYFPYPTIDIRSINLLHQSFVDGLVGHRVHKMARYTRNSTKVYYYQNRYAGRLGRIMNDRNVSLGVGHGNDMQYVFYPNFVTAHKFLPSDPESFMVERMTRIWEYFAATG